MQTTGGRLLRTIAAVVFLSAPVIASDALIRGTVTDSNGKPVRGAIVKATVGGKSISRYSQKDGHYEIVVSPGSYDVSVEAFGFAPKTQTKDTAQASEANFTLSPNLSVGRLSSADLESLLPDNRETKQVTATCVFCHTLENVVHRAGGTAGDWQQFLPTMVAKASVDAFYTLDTKIVPVSQILEKDLGPDSQYLTPDALRKIKHPEMSDAALRGSYREYAVPGPPGRGLDVHSVMVDHTDKVWFSNPKANAMTRFDPETETFKDFAMPVAKSFPHTGVVAKTGIAWMGMFNDGPKLVSVDPETGEVNGYVAPGKQGGAHTIAEAPDGNIWSGGFEVYCFDVKTKQYSLYKLPVPDAYPADSMGDRQLSPGQPHDAVIGFIYDIKVDSKGTVWVAQLMTGDLLSLNPKTEEWKTYRVPGMVSFRGLAVDAQDNIWFGNYLGHTLGKLDVKTGAIKQYKAPTANQGVYGLVINKQTGAIWYSESLGNNITKFDPKTEQFTEYPIPSDHSYPRYIGSDSKGRIWFGETSLGKIGVLDPGR